MLSKITVEAALNADLDDHLGFDKHEQSDSDNNRNGVTHKTLQTEDGQFELATPRDRMASCWWVCRKGDHRIEYLCCKSACKNDPLTGVIGVQN